MNTPVIPEHTPRAALAIVQRYDGAVNYLYPLLINMSHKHRVLRDSMIAALFEQYRLFYEAAKSNQVSPVSTELATTRRASASSLHGAATPNGPTPSTCSTA